MTDPTTLERVRGLDRRLTKIGRKIRMLGTLAWPEDREGAFLASVARGAPEIPEAFLPPTDAAEERDALAGVLRDLDLDHPLEAFLARTADSYVQLCQMLEAVGTPRFTELSIVLFGAPSDALHEGSPTALEAARHFTRRATRIPCHTEQCTLSAEEAAERLRARIAPHFGDELGVELDPGLRAFATAGSSRVRLRATARFSLSQIDQLAEHEALVHAATKRNGRAQPVLTALGLSSPRTTATQEGLATLAELITDTIDLARLERIALRVQAVHAALEGADFVEVFRLFETAGQPSDESYHSTVRCFRGGDPRGGVVFTKDVAYLPGLLRTHTFVLEALAADRHDLVVRLWAGRMTLGDVLDLDPFFGSALDEPSVVPLWVRDPSRLAAHLAWTSWMSYVDLGAVELDDFREPAAGRPTAPATVEGGATVG